MMAKNLFQQEFRTPSVRELFGEHMDDLGLPLGPPTHMFFRPESSGGVFLSLKEPGSLTCCLHARLAAQSGPDHWHIRPFEMHSLLSQSNQVQ